MRAETENNIVKKKIIFIILFVVLILTLIISVSGILRAELANTPWPMFRQNLYHTGVSTIPVSGSVGILKWRYLTGSNVQSSPAIGLDGTVYVGSNDNYLHAICSSGTIKWKYQTDDTLLSAPAIGADGTVYVGSFDNYLHAICSTGTIKWKYQTGNLLASSPAIGTGGTVYVGSADKYLHAICSTGTIKWKYQTDENVQSSPAIGSDGTVYVGSYDNYLHAICSSGTVKWKYQMGNSVNSTPAIGPDGTVYIGSYDYYLHAVNPSGTMKWKYQTSDFVPSSPAIGSDGTIYVGNYDGYLYAINTSGTLKWLYLTGGTIQSSPAIGLDGTIYIGSNDDYLYAISPNGTLKWKYKTGGDVYSSPAIGSDGTIYVGSNDGYLYAIIVTTPPTLSWTGEPNYTSDGLDLESGSVSTSFNFRVKYTDDNNDAPKSGYPKVHIKKGGSEIASSPFTMAYVSGENNTGAIYTYSKMLDTIGTDYTYYFEAYDIWSTTATGSPTSAIDAPDVSDPILTSITPAVASNSGLVSITSLTGNGWFVIGSEVKISKSGQSSIDATNVNVANNSTITCNLDLTGIVTGYWDVVVATGGAGSFFVTLSSGLLVNIIDITAITPISGYNSSPISITNLAGVGFTANSTVKLAKGGQSNIVGTNVVAVSSVQITCVFDLAGKAIGYWNVEVSTGGLNSASATLSNGFLISPMAVTSITPNTGLNTEQVSITDLAGAGFVSGSTVKLKQTGEVDINATDVIIVNQSKITCAFNLIDMTTGYWDVMVSTGGDGSVSAVLTDGFLITALPLFSTITVTNIDKTLNTTVSFKSSHGEVKVYVPAGTFRDDVVLTVCEASVPRADRSEIKLSAVGIEIKNDKGLQPLKDITITLDYGDTDVSGLDVDKLVLAYYDEKHSRWLSLPSTSYPNLKKVTGTARHLSKFAIVQLAASSNLSAVKAYPVPFNPLADGNMTMDNLTNEADIRIYNVVGELIRKLEYTSGNGRAKWDGKNDSGILVGSGVYIITIEHSTEMKRIKVIVEK
ncbi:MAG: PQQ-binding-like beta-propeller repeat protein [Elusimicrobiota bacterium]